MSNWENLTSGLLSRCMETFGKTATYIPKSGDPEFEVDGVFDRPFLNVELGQDNNHQSTAPSFGVKASDMETDPVDGDQIIIGGVTFNVFEVQEDGQGHIKLLLHED